MASELAAQKSKSGPAADASVAPVVARASAVQVCSQVCQVLGVTRLRPNRKKVRLQRDLHVDSREPASGTAATHGPSGASVQWLHLFEMRPELTDCNRKDLATAHITCWHDACL